MERPPFRAPRRACEVWGEGWTSRFQTSAPRETVGFGKRQRRIMVERLMLYMTTPRVGVPGPGNRAAIVFFTFRARKNESTAKTMKKPRRRTVAYPRIATLG